MNHRKKITPLTGLAYRLMLASRVLTGKKKCNAFGAKRNDLRQIISRIVTINVDTQVSRWIRVQRELGHLWDKEDKPLLELTTRFSAVDAKKHLTDGCQSALISSYTLADQLFVEPQPLLDPIGIDGNQQITMSRQECAVALSHVKVWDMVANGDDAYALVIEDDVYFTGRFASVFADTWADLVHNVSRSKVFDLLYLSYEEVKGGAKKEFLSEYLMRPHRGLWNLSGYVLSKDGAKKLLALLPARGPIDLWLNLQFEKLIVFASTSSLIEQRRDYGSSNSYSVLPVLSKLGVLTDEGPARFDRRSLLGPIFAIGPVGSGLTSLAMALSMLGYRCCSDLDELPGAEDAALYASVQERMFDAYVNVGSVTRRCMELTSMYPHCRFIITVEDDPRLARSPDDGREGVGGAGCEVSREEGADGPDVTELVEELQRLSVKHLILRVTGGNGWEELCGFLGCEPPVSQFPSLSDRPKRRLNNGRWRDRRVGWKSKRLKYDRSPWIADGLSEWHSVPTDAIDACASRDCACQETSEKMEGLGNAHWIWRDDTFPSNLALFRPENVSIENDNCGVLSLRREDAYVRNYTSAAISSRQQYLYGKFEAEILPASVPGVITGMFLHRSSPRQEIDIEFLGRDCRKMLANVYYNPGVEGTKYDYGFRGTPVLIELGFDASENFHRYSIEWCQNCIRWFVDGRLVHERVNWEPTPIPHLPMQFPLNLWASRSRELTGRLAKKQLPTQSRIRCVGWRACHSR